MVLNQIFNLNAAKQRLSKLQSQVGNEKFTPEEEAKLKQKIRYAEKGVKKGWSKLGQGIALEGVAIAKFVYNYNAKISRFGLRGQDIQDQLKLQDKAVNKAFGIIGATIVGGLAGGIKALGSAIIGEVLTINAQNKAYEYRKMIDAEQKQIMQERIGRAVFNASRRT